MTGPAGALLLDHRRVRLDPSLSEQSAFELALEPLSALFEPVAKVGDERRHALLTVTQDGGSRTSVAFWAAALHTGLGLASPADFPWCLANASCASLARRFAVTGPNYTWLVADLSETRAFVAAAEVLAGELDPAGPPRFVWVMANRFCGPDPRIDLWLWGQGGATGAPAHDLAAGMAQGWAKGSAQGSAQGSART